MMMMKIDDDDYVAMDLYLK